MDDDTKKYFDQLVNPGAGVDAEAAAEEEVPVELTRASSAPASTRSKKSIPITHATEEPNFGPYEMGEEAEGQLTIDVYQTPNEIVVESTIAGVTNDDLDIDITTDSVTIRGKRRRQTEVRDEDYLYQECYWGRFSRSIILPQEVDPDKAQAALKNGILTVVLPKLRRERGKKLKIRFD